MQLLKQTEKQRVYQLDFKIYVYGFGKTIKALFEADPIKLIEGLELAEDVSGYIDKVCISDSSHHIERLAFPAFNIRDIETGDVRVVWRCNTICGYNTFRIHGGDPAAVWPDAVYIRRLRMLNRMYNA